MTKEAASVFDTSDVARSFHETRFDGSGDNESFGGNQSIAGSVRLRESAANLSA